MPLTEEESIQQFAPSLSRFVAEQLGLNFPPERWPEMWRGLCLACPELGFNIPEKCVEAILNAPLNRPRAEILASHLTIGETYFFRDQQSFQILQDQILPELLSARRDSRSLRIWSAGCATGEEAYSIAMLLHRFFPEVLSWHLMILGTDINPRFLHKANQGIYTPWSFRGTPDWVKEAYFDKAPSRRFEIQRKIRQMVTFSYLNLAQDAFPSILNGTNAIDLIFCRNVLMYFQPDTAAEVVLKFNRTLVEDGWLSVSPYDVSHLKSELFSPSPHFGIVFHQKTRAAVQPPRNPVESHNPGTAPRPRFPNSRRSTERKMRESDTFEVARKNFVEGEYAAVVQVLSAHARQRPADLPAVELLARALANCGRLNEALQWCSKGLAVDELNAALQFLRATILQEQGETELAIQDLRRVLYLDSDHLLAHFGLANILHFQHRFPEANHHFRAALSLLKALDSERVLPEFDGMTVGRLREIIESTIDLEQAE